MKIISHRGNIAGSNRQIENQPAYIQAAMSKGYDVEIDVWYIDDKILLGHDYGQYQVSLDFLKTDNLWCHAKNLDSLEFMLSNDIHCFWHQEDDRTITSRGFIWTYEGRDLGKKSVACWMDAIGDIPSLSIYGICTDYPDKLKDLLKN
jgi:hypothetical protein